MTDTPPPAPVLGRPGHAYQTARLRWAQTRDAERLALLWQHAYADAGEDAASMAAWFEHGGALVLEDRAGELLAAVRWCETSHGWRVDRVATQREHRGQGYGRWLMTNLEAAAIRANVPRLQLFVPRDTRPEQLAYYARMGYQATDDGGEALRLEKRVGGTWQTKAPGATSWVGASA